MRPILEVLASFVKISNKTKKVTGQQPYLNNDLWATYYRNTTDAIVDNLMISNGEIDRAIFSISNLLTNHRNKVYIVWMDDLIGAPKETIDSIYKFLGLDTFSHNFNNIKEVDKHNDFAGYGMVGLHDVRKKLAQSKTQPSKILSKYVIEKYGNALDFLKF
jgi:hypothetical protein